MLLALTEGVSIILAMLVVGLLFLAVVALGELTHWALARRKHARTAGRAGY